MQGGVCGRLHKHVPRIYDKIGSFNVMNKLISIIMRQKSISMSATAQEVSKSYEEAVRALNTLQSNASVLEKVKAERDRKRHLSLPETIAMAERAGVPMSDIDELSVIHVSGTKGKGSTCAFCESILRAHGLRTGFFSSPHLVEVRERVRINGTPLSRAEFSEYFWDCYNKLDATKEDHEGAMPPYFRFLTIMAFHVFIQEKVDVVLLEVGIGGEYDCTNIINRPVVCGVTSLGLDHTSILGDTIAKIAWHKAGIFKKGVEAVTVPQPPAAMEVMHDRAEEKQCSLSVSPPLEQYSWPGGAAGSLGIPGTLQSINASLALQLTRIWFEKHGVMELSQIKRGEPFELTPAMARGLAECRWLGRSQTVSHPGLTYYLDGAHTSDSTQACADWFREVSKHEVNSIEGSVVKILFFNTTGDRKPHNLLQPLVGLDFDYAVFSPNIASLNATSADQTNLTVSLQSQTDRCSLNRNAFLSLLQEHNSTTDTPVKENSGTTPKNDTTDPIPTFSFNCIHDALQWASQGRDTVLGSAPRGSHAQWVPDKLSNAAHIQILCTGSLHLIGGVIGLICPPVDTKNDV